MSHSCHDGARMSRDLSLTDHTPAPTVSRPVPVAKPGLGAPGLAPSRIPAGSSFPGAALAWRKPLARPSQIPVASAGKDGAGRPRSTSPVLDVVGKGGGRPLDLEVRADMEAQLGSDFSDVRIHAGDKAARSAAAISATAYTVANEVVFGRGYFDPASQDGKHRLAHELVHVQQQRHGVVPGADRIGGVTISDPAGPFEQEAEATAARVASGPSLRAAGDLRGHHRGKPRDQLTEGRSMQPSAALVQKQGLVQRQQASERIDAPRGSESDYRNAAQGYIGDYKAAAKDGVTEFTIALPGASIDWNSFWGNVAGNVVWALASFSTGGEAFIISIAGVGLSTVATYPTSASGFDKNAFITQADQRIDKYEDYLNDQVARVVSSVYAQSVSSNWNDNQTRLELLGRMFSDGEGTYYKTFSGGLPNVNQAAITASVKEELLVLANAEEPRQPSPGWEAIDTPIRDYHGYVMYSYKVPNEFTIRHVDAWTPEPPSVALVPSANIGDINKSMNEAQRHGFPNQAFDVSKFQCKRAINIYKSEPEDPTLMVELSESNTVVDTKGWHGAEDALGSPDYNRQAFGAYIVHKVWGPDGTPPKAASLGEAPAQFKLPEVTPAL